MKFRLAAHIVMVAEAEVEAESEAAAKQLLVDGKVRLGEPKEEGKITFTCVPLEEGENG